MSAAKVLFIGLDAAERDLLLKWSDEGLLPNIARLRERGLQGEAEVVPGFGSGAMWPSFATGVSPAKHGRYFGSAPSDGYASFKRAHEIRATPFWEALSEKGHKVAVIDVPYARLAANLNGLQLLDWAIHNPVEDQPVSLPAELASEMVEKYGSDPVGPCDNGGRGQDDFHSFRDRLLERVEKKTQLGLDLLARDSWDMYAMVFDESHCASHQTWHLHDPAHPEHDAKLAAELGDPVRDVLQAIDRGIGKLLACTDDNSIVVLASITGMGPNYTANWILEDMLRSYEGETGSLWLAALSAARSGWRKLPASWRHAIRRKTKNVEEKAIRANERSRRASFTLPHNDISGLVRINLKGREPSGIVEPEDYQQYLDGLIAYLKQFTNAETGEPLIKYFVEPRKIMSGEHIEDMPDLLVEWNRSAPIRRVYSPATGELENTYRGNRLGDHTIHGLTVTAGPGIQPGVLDEAFSVMDLAPTLCALLGEQMPGDIDGKVVRRMLPRASKTAEVSEAEPA